MNVLHWIAKHYVLALLLASAAFVILWCVFLGWFGESDEKRDERRRRESRERTHARLKAIAEEYKRRERAKHETAMSAAVETVREAMQVSNGEAQGRDAEEWDAASNGKRCA